MDTRPAASAIGTLDMTPLAHVLVYARNKQLSGLLELRASDGREGTIGFYLGAIVSARIVPATTFFGGVAYELGLIDGEVLAESLHEIATTKRLHGEVLVERGHLTEEQRDFLLAEQTCRKVQELFTFPRDTAYAFYEVAPPQGLAIETLAPVWRALRELPLDEAGAKVLSRYATARLRIVDSGPFSVLGFSEEERALLEELEDNPMTLEDMRAFSTLRPERVDLIAYFLLIAKCVSGSASTDRDASGSRRKYIPSMSFRVTQEVPPMPGPVEMGADAVVALAQRLDRTSFHALLGLAEGATYEAVRAAYLRLAKIWHPRHLPPDLSYLHSEVQAIYDRMCVAHRTLTDDTERTATLARTTARNDREELLRQVELALRHRDFAFAEGTARALLESDPNDAEALALVAWALCFAGDGPDEARSAARHMLDRAVALDRGADRAFYFRGLLRKKSGDAEGAYRDFVRAVQANPKHVDAEREAVAYETRQRLQRSRA